MTIGDSLSSNLYIYCRDSSLNYLDYTGNEDIVVSGGIDDKSKIDYIFIEPALKKINDDIEGGIPNEDITWLVINAGYTEEQMSNFQDTANNLGVNFVSANNKDEFISYINDKNGGTTRADDKITDMTFFSHGQCPKYSGSEENQLSFAYHIKSLEKKSPNINFTQSDIAKLNADAFNNTLTLFYSCNAGTDDFNGKNFAQEWTNKTGGVSYGIKNGRSYYGMMNMAGYYGFYIPTITAFAPGELWNMAWNTQIWQDKQARKKDRAEKGYSELGSLHYPTLVCLAGDMDVLFSSGIFSRGWTMFTPQLTFSAE